MGSFSNERKAAEDKFCTTKSCFHFVEEIAVDRGILRSSSSPALGRLPSETTQDSCSPTDSTKVAPKHSIDSSFVLSSRTAGISGIQDDSDDDDDSEDDIDYDNYESADVHVVILRGIPCSFYVEDILKLTRDLGINDEPDFFFVPVAAGRNLGKALVGFADRQTTEDFAKLMRGHRFCSGFELVTGTPASLFGLA
jgi:hypothetical protein